ncbi:hypothetical protein G6F70_006228 [Rhizopus microsporus]|nr:hypothetical protein G6F71_007071 [Rhizopus microsporus]KAG1197929.1 hypothetical protein G6F70_006228 [Rhizopus microsporus]KAG1208697.1 hypothetical protein G6F69_006998 [Rhizopus microsporus]KAG1227720.1 hypothetical protein G6F67_008278 [Rhizopus microsporus]KAG1259105.1 hypothetical protein G6F68_008344 [Rhizopus microsporus]
MDKFNRPPPDIDNIDNEQPYVSLTQFDTELQQQAQLVMEQDIDVWQDFENYLPLAYQQSNSRNISQPTNSQLLDFMTNNDLPFNSVLSTQNNSSLKLYPQQNNMWPSNDISFISPHSDPIPSPFSSPSSIPEPLSSPGQLTTPFEPSSTATTVNIALNNSASSTPDQSPKAETFSLNFISVPDQQQQQHQQLNNLACKPTIKIAQSQDKATAQTSNPSSAAPQQKKRAHNVIERRYRNNINERITELKNAVPALLHAKVKDGNNSAKTGAKRGRKSSHDDDDDDDDNEDDEEYLDGVAIATKLNKATILRKATEYILHLRRSGDVLRHENDILQSLIGQLPGGQEILSRYLLQKMQRDQEMQQQISYERQLQKQMKQRRKYPVGRKRSRLSTLDDGTASQVKHEPVPLVPATPSVTNRVFMAAFMAISFFSSSPLFTGPTTKEQFESHHHISRTVDEYPSNNGNRESSLLGLFFSTQDTWSTFRTTIFVICLFQLLFPLFKSWILGSLRIKSVNKRSRVKSSSSGNIASHVTSLTPGDQKCMQIYNILAKSLENDSNNRKRAVFPQKRGSTVSLCLSLCKEIARFISRHWLGYEILYDDHDLAPQEQWIQTCKWIKLNEVECLGGNPQITRISMLFSCFRVLNLIEMMEDDENEYVEQSRSRVYATAALQMALIIPHHGISQSLSKYFWRMAMYESGLEDDPLMSALTFDCHEDDGEDRIEVMLKSRAWNETLEVMSHQIQHFKQDRVYGLSLSMNAPVLVPVGILSTLHLLDNLQTQFGRLIISVTAAPLLSDELRDEEEEDSDFNETAFAQILDMTTPQEDHERVDDYHRLAHWLAAVGAIVEALWKSDTKTANKLINTILEKIPLSLVSREMMGSDVDMVGHKERLNQLDGLTKKSIIHTLVGAALLKKGKPEDLFRGVEELWNAERIKMTMKKLLARIDNNHEHRNQILKDSEDIIDLESSVLGLAEFVTAVTGLEATST